MVDSPRRAASSGHGPTRSQVGRRPATMTGLCCVAILSGLACSSGGASVGQPAPAVGESRAAPATAPPASSAPAAPAAQREPTVVRITDLQITSGAGEYIAAEKG